MCQNWEEYIELCGWKFLSSQESEKREETTFYNLNGDILKSEKILRDKVALAVL